MQDTFENLPRHVAIVMDGNRRWAKSKGLLALNGHRQGAKTVKNLIGSVLQYGIEYITLYAFSSENWNRPQEEVTGLMDLLQQYLSTEIDSFHEKKIRLRVIGDKSGLKESVRLAIEEAERATASYSRLNLTFAINYGSRNEIVRAIKKVATDVVDKKLNIDDIDETSFNNYLDTHDLPDPDFFVRTSGEYRISNFLLWQLSYAELYFTDVSWPEFNDDEFLKALASFDGRRRRFGR